MKVSIWQQFSSNHSANFTVVGKFATVEDALESEAKIRDIIKQIGDYYREHLDESQLLEQIFIETLSPVEQEIKEHYSADEWGIGLEWTFYDTPNQTVKRHRNLLFVSNHSNTWTGHPPFHQILDRLGAIVAFSTEGSQGAYVSLTCTAPNEAIAANLERQMHSVEVTGDYIEIPESKLRVRGKVNRDGKRLRFGDVSPRIGIEDARDTATVLDALYTYLEEQGCTAFNYELSERK